MFLVVFTFFFWENVHAGCMKEISITGYDLVPNFNTDIHKYNVFINGNSILIKGKSKNNSSEVSGIGNFDVLKDEEEYIIKCDEEEYVIKTFKGVLTEDGTDAYLSSLKIDGIDIDFDKNVFSYEIEREGQVLIEYELSDDRATAKIIENDNNEIIITVTSFDKTVTQEYVVKMNELKTVSSENVKNYERKELNSFQKSGVILILSSIVLIIMNFIRKKIF